MVAQRVVNPNFPAYPSGLPKYSSFTGPSLRGLLSPETPKLVGAKIRLRVLQTPQPDPELKKIYLEPKRNRHRDLLEEALLHWRLKKDEQIEPSDYLCIWCWANSGMHQFVMYSPCLSPCFLFKLLNDNSIFQSSSARKMLIIFVFISEIESRSCERCKIDFTVFASCWEDSRTSANPED